MRTKEFTLRKFKLEYIPGYSFKEDLRERLPRYEGEVLFSNREGESFMLKMDKEISFKVLEIINQKLAENTEILVSNIKAAIENEKDKI